MHPENEDASIKAIEVNLFSSFFLILCFLFSAHMPFSSDFASINLNSKLFYTFKHSTIQNLDTTSHWVE